MSKHTPGPWKTLDGHYVFTAAQVEKHRISGIGNDDQFICSLDDGGEYHEYTDKEELLANAELIARAPALLEENEHLHEITRHLLDAAVLFHAMLGVATEHTDAINLVTPEQEKEVNLHEIMIELGNIINEAKKIRK